MGTKGGVPVTINSSTTCMQDFYWFWYWWRSMMSWRKLGVFHCESANLIASPISVICSLMGHDLDISCQFKA